MYWVHAVWSPSGPRGNWSTSLMSSDTERARWGNLSDASRGVGRLRKAELSGAVRRGADVRSADLDSSCLTGAPNGQYDDLSRRID
jgi:uncharacterized protein YjbI with pentapeptide repeats